MRRDRVRDRLARTRAARSLRPTANWERMEDRRLLATFVVNTTADAGAGSLRQALTDANTTAGADLITFNIGSGNIIQLASRLPSITEQVTIDATTQPGYSGSPLVRVDGPGLSSSGFTIATNNSTIKGLAINRFFTGITITGNNNTVQACWIGPNLTGNAGAGNVFDGIDISGANNLIGGSVAGAGNVISANGSFGVFLQGNSAGSNVISGNIIGLGADGTTRLGNGDSGIFSNGLAATSIGGFTPEARNIIAGNAGPGIEIQGTTAKNTAILGNYIGTDLSGTLGRANVGGGIFINGTPFVSIGGILGSTGNVISGNTGPGIEIQGATATNTNIKRNLIGTQADGATGLPNSLEGIFINGGIGSIIGGDTANDGNVIAFNGLSGSTTAGINVFSGFGNRILSNSIFSNAGLGIDIGTKGVNPNTSTSPSSNIPNQGQNYPVLNKVDSAGSFTNVAGTLTSIPNSPFTIQFFSDAGDPSGFGEGKTFLGSVNVTADANGLASFNVRLTTGVAVGSLVTATATDITPGSSTSFSTSEFARNVSVTAAKQVDIAVTSAFATNPILVGKDAGYDITITNNGPDDATNVVLSDSLPTNATFVSSTAGTYDGPNNRLNLTIPSLPAGSSQVVRIVVNPTGVGSLNNTAVVTPSEIDVDTSNNSSTLSGTINPAVNLQLTLIAAPEPVAIGDTLSYIIAVQNAGPSTASSVVVNVTLPGSLSSIGVDTQGTFSFNGNVLTVTLGQIVANGVGNITIKGNTGSIGSISATASVSTPEAELDPTDNTATVTSNVAPAADLTLAVTSNPNPVLVSAALTYDLSVTNNGPSDATGAVLAYTLPANVTLVSATSPDGKVSVNGNSIRVTFNTIINGGIASARIVVTPTASGSLASTFLLSNQSEVDLKPSDNTAVDTVLVSPADLGVTITGSSQPILSGSQTDITIVVANNGPSTADNVNLASLLPAGLTFVSATASGGGTFSINGQSFSASLASLASGSVFTIVITATPAGSGTLDLSATASADEFDPVSDNDTATAQLLVDPIDLIVGIQASATPIVVGSNLVYTFRVTNNGPADATGVVLTSPVLAKGALVGVATSTGKASVSSGQIVYSIGTLAVGGSATITVTFRADAAGTYAPTATVAADQSDTDENSNKVTGSLPVINRPGTFVVGSATASVKENAGSVTLTIKRVLGNLGTVTIHYATADGTAKAGVNYTATSGTLTFLAGETSKTIVIPVRQDGAITDALGFTLNLSSPGGGALLGQPNSVKVSVVNVDRDLIAPKVTGVQAVTANGKITGFLISFSEAMDSAKAGDLRNYAIAVSGRDLARPTADAGLTLAGATYLPGQNAVRIDLFQAQPLNRFYKITVNGSTATAPADKYGNVLDGDANGTAGGNYLAFNALGSNLRYIDSNGDAVTVKLTGGGLMSLTRGASGEGSLLNLIGITPRRSKIGGTVQRSNGRGDGRTLINTITGFGKFGDVFSVLTTPPFFTRTQATSSSASIVVPVVGPKAVPQGPRKK